MRRRSGSGVVTLRNLPPRLGTVLRSTARSEKLSLNKTVIQLLEERLALRGGRAESVLHHDLDALSGVWSKEEADQFDRALADQRLIDPDLWR